MKNRVVITGLGVLSACGIGWQPLWEACLQRRSALRPISRYVFEKFPAAYGGEVPDFDPRKYVQNRKNIKLMSRDIQFAVAASKLAFEDAGILLSTLDLARSGVIIGSGVINNELEELAPGYLKAVQPDGSFSMPHFGSHGVPALFPLWMLKYLPNMPASHITIEFGLRGYSNTVTFSAASGAQAIGEAARVIERGDADVMLAGGADSKLNPMGLSRFQLFGMLSESGKHGAFDQYSDGMVVGEGAGILVLESLEHAQKRNAKIYAELSGFGSAPDANSSPLNHSDGTGKEKAMNRAMNDARITFSDLDAVIANGSGLIQHDQLEAKALKLLLNVSPKTSVTALKPIFGHAVYAAGGIEAAIAAITVDEDKLPPASVLNPIEKLSFASEIISKPINTVMLNSFGFCGQNTALVIKKYVQGDRPL